MTQEERLDALIEALKAEQPQYAGLGAPGNPQDKRNLLRGLMNLRPARPAGKAFLQVWPRRWKNAAWGYKGTWPWFCEI